MLQNHTADLALRVAALPLLGVLAAVAAVRDNAARVRLRDDEHAAELAVSWARLTAEQQACLLDWTVADRSAL